MVEDGEIDVGGLALGAAHRVGAVVGECDAAQDAAESLRRRLDRGAALRRKLLAMIAQSALQDRPLIGDLGRDECRARCRRAARQRDTAPAARARCR